MSLRHSKMVSIGCILKSTTTIKLSQLRKNCMYDQYEWASWLPWVGPVNYSKSDKNAAMSGHLQYSSYKSYKVGTHV